MRVLGLSAFHRGSAAALWVDGRIVAAAPEAHFTRKLGDASFPRSAARSCLDIGGLSADELDAVVFHEKPLRKFERVLVSQLQAFPRSSRSFAKDMFLWLGDRLWLKARIADELATAAPIVFVEHLRAHAAVSFFLSPHEEAAVLALGDAGEWATVLLARGRGRELETLSEIHFPHSLGLWYSAFTQFLGFEAGRDEERLEALARFGRPSFEAEVATTLPELEGGAFAVDLRCFRFGFDAERLFDGELERRLGPRRAPGVALRFGAADARDADLAASVQAVLEARVLALVRKLRAETGLDALCLAGELANNRALVARVVADGGFARVFVPPLPGEAGAALGAALEYAVSIGGGARDLAAELPRSSAGLAPRPEDGATTLGDEPALQECMVERLARGERIAWARGALELGPRSLGARLLLAAATAPDARGRLLGAVQQDEAYLPCRIAVPEERAQEFFRVPSGCEQALRSGHLDLAVEEPARRAAPALIGPDGKAWVQLVERSADPGLHALLSGLEGATGAPLAALASFQLRGQTIVRTEADAVEAFRRSALDALFVEDRLYQRAAT